MNASSSQSGQSAHTQSSLLPLPQRATAYEVSIHGQLYSFSALNSKLAAAAVSEGLKEYEGELSTIGEVSVAALAKIKQVKKVSESLTKIAKVLDLGLALLAASAAPSPATTVALVNAGSAVADL